jgi:hypothetical protein
MLLRGAVGGVETAPTIGGAIEILEQLAPRDPTSLFLTGPAHAAVDR